MLASGSVRLANQDVVGGNIAMKHASFDEKIVS